jgi:hypothetical protein
MSDSCMYVPRVRTSCSLLKVVTCMCALQPTEGYHVYVSVCPAIDCCLPRTCLYAPRARTTCTRLVSATCMCVPHPTAVVNVVSRHARSRQCAPSFWASTRCERRCVTVCHGLLRHERPPAQRHAHVSISRALPIAAARDQLQRCPLMYLSAQGTISQPRVGRSAALHGMHTSLCLLSYKTTTF